ncbi:MAG: 30S ribosomal protein S20 [Spiroplasmataceae bacterium]|jgi:small subunit ribosomal protein S20|nr:30S ribosomal protein S20 [Spiroplasmataceae bacterium]
MTKYNYHTMPIEEEKKSKEKQARNRKYKTLIKNQFKKIEIFKDKDNKEELKKLIAETQSILDKAKNKKVIHINKSARKKSQLYKKLVKN